MDAAGGNDDSKRQKPTPVEAAGVSASLALQASGILRDVALCRPGAGAAHADVDALTLYVERHAVPALAINVLYNYYGRVFEPDHQCPDSDYYNDWNFEDFRGDQPDPGEASIFRSDRRLRIEMQCRLDSRYFQGFAGYAPGPEDRTFEDYLRRLPGRVRTTLMALPADRVLKIRIFLEVAHGRDIEQLPEDPLRLDDHQGPVLYSDLRRLYADDPAASNPTTPVVLLDTYQEKSSMISSHPIEIPAYVPRFQTGDPKPITRSIVGPTGYSSRPNFGHVCF